MSKTPIETRLTEHQAKALKAMGFTHVVVVANRTSVRPAGSVEAAFRSNRDAARFRRVLDHTFGTGLYEERKL